MPEGAGPTATTEVAGGFHLRPGGPTLLSGWGRTAPTAVVVAVPADADAVAALVGAPPPGAGLVARGLGRSYGDAAQCAGGTVVDCSRLDAVGEVDPTTGELTVGAGASLQRLLEHALPRGWFLPVTPGTRSVTVGGAIAADVHGKNHHRDGSLSAHLSALTLATPTGAHRLRPATGSAEGDLFWATAGGMGLTGVVTSATLRMLAVETDQVTVDTDRHGDLDSVMAAMVAGDDRYRYSVAWVDCMATGRRTGRAILTRGDHARRADLPSGHRDRPLVAPTEPRVRVPRPAPPHLLNPLSVAAFNELWFRRAPRHRVGELVPVGRFFHPLDGVADWNLLYGRRGFLQYQFVVADPAVVARVIELLAHQRVPSFLGVLKRFGPAAAGPLSFPAPGWTLALDLPVLGPALGALLDRIDEMVAEAGGRVYLAKDARLRPDLLATMYPRLGELADVRQRVDPAGVLRSDLSRRLGLDRKEGS